MSRGHDGAWAPWEEGREGGRGRRCSDSPAVGASVGASVGRAEARAVGIAEGAGLGGRGGVGAELGAWAGASVGLGTSWPSFTRKPLPLMKVVALHEPT